VPTLDTRVSRQVARARLLETAVHISDEWSITRNGITAPARRILLDDRVRFEAVFPPGDYGEEAYLLLQGEFRSYICTNPIDTGPEQTLTFQWDIVISESASR
jgi:hypothetical protein